jgi:hypothetical protein
MQSKQNGKPNTYHELLGTLKQPGCAICRSVDGAVRQRIDAFLYEQIMIIERRTEIREARGFCSAHGTLLNGVGYMLGNAILQQDVLNDVLREMSKYEEASAQRRKMRSIKSFTQGLFNRAGAIVNAIKPKRECVLCEYERDREAMYLRTLINYLHEAEMREAFAASGGLCLPHFRVALGLNEIKNENLPALIEIETEILSKLKAELDEFLHKSNASFGFTQADMGSEADAPLRALKLVSGRVIHSDGR